MKKRRIVSFILTFVMTLSMFSGVYIPLAFAEETSGAVVGDMVYDLILHYDMRNVDGIETQKIVRDVSGYTVNFDGILKNAEKSQVVKNDKVGFISFKGGSASANSSYVEIPKGSDGKDVLEHVDE